jgi:predicted transcriptional regulator
MTKKTYYKNTVPMIWAVAVLRDDFNMTWQAIGDRLGRSPSTARALYLEFDNVKNKTFKSKKQPTKHVTLRIPSEIHNKLMERVVIENISFTEALLQQIDYKKLNKKL